MVIFENYHREKNAKEREIVKKAEIMSEETSGKFRGFMIRIELSNYNGSNYCQIIFKLVRSN